MSSKIIEKCKIILIMRELISIPMFFFKKLSTSIKRLTSFVLLCGSAMIVNVIISPWFLIAAVPTSCAYYVLQRFYRRSARQLQRLDGRYYWWYFIMIFRINLLKNLHNFIKEMIKKFLLILLSPYSIKIRRLQCAQVIYDIHIKITNNN